MVAALALLLFQMVSKMVGQAVDNNIMELLTHIEDMELA
jgi:hypothetical protein